MHYKPLSDIDWVESKVKNVFAAKRYCPMLMEEGGSVILHHLHDNIEVNPSVRDICQNILDVLSAERYSSELSSPQM
jgi:hypothetical protein